MADNFQLRRIRHLRIDSRTIAPGTGTGGSASVAVLHETIDATVCREGYAVRTEVGS